jgi:hypothetical protein
MSSDEKVLDFPKAEISRSRSGMTIGALRLLSGDLCQEAAELQ